MARRRMTATAMNMLTKDRKKATAPTLQPGPDMARVAASGPDMTAKAAAAGSPMAMLSTCGSAASDPSNPILIFVVVLALGLACIGLARYALKNKRKW